MFFSSGPLVCDETQKRDTWKTRRTTNLWDAIRPFTVLCDSMKMFTCLLLCKQLQGLPRRIRERRLPAAAAPLRWHCTAPNSAASARYLHALLRQELPPVTMKLPEESSKDADYCGRTLKNLQDNTRVTSLMIFCPALLNAHTDKYLQILTFKAPSLVFFPLWSTTTKQGWWINACSH